MVIHGGSLIGKILPGKVQRQTELTAEEVSYSHLQPGRWTTLYTGFCRKGIAAVQDLVLCRYRPACGERNGRLPAQGTSDGGFSKKLDGYNRFAYINSIVSIGSG